MISAFGVEHAISKSLKPPHKAALMREALKDSGWGWEDYRRSTYATDRLALHGSKDNYKGKLPLASKYRHQGMARLTRVRRKDRDKNRKPIFGSEETKK